MNTDYPEKFIERIEEITISSLENQFIYTEVDCDLKYLAMDQLTHGEVVSLIPIDSVWCRGYMMIQAEQTSITHAIQAGRTHLDESDTMFGFKSCNQVIGEITNLIWGALKNEFFSKRPDAAVQAQVPILLNYAMDHVSFASKIPQLCLDYDIEHKDGILPGFTLYQKFVFNLNWQPELFEENWQTDNITAGRGNLEIF